VLSCNQKPGRRLLNGLAPLARLRESEGRIYRAARQFLEEVRALAEKNLAARHERPRSGSSSIENSTRSLAGFHADPRYGGDLHRADMAWALHAASRGLSEQQITDEIPHARDLSRKGGPARQLDYAERTAVKAVSAP